jgi:hypothetical protein
LASNLSLHIDGIDADDLARGVRAAEEIFRDHSMSPAEADHGRWRRDLCEALGLADDPMALSRRDATAAYVWDEAVRAALAAACPWNQPAVGLEAQLRLTPAPVRPMALSP